MKTWSLALLLCLAGPALRASDKGVGGFVTGTAMVAGMEIPMIQILVTPKPDYVHIIWDAFPQHDDIKAAGKAFTLEGAAMDLAKGPGLAAVPGATEFKVDVAEFPVRDEYDAPRWSDLRFLGRFVLTRHGKRWVVKKRAE
ncbi:MAG TPA: hypothetical protein VNZ54_02930 [bacterium]|jgi:hypothetical protein|nr:hypothetical protein [bacterium]